jgi:hypothetical protein
MASTAIVKSPATGAVAVVTGWIQGSDVDTVHWHPLSAPLATLTKT